MSNRIFSLVAQSVKRNKRDFIFSSIGIIVGIGTLIFFTALGTGVKETVLEKIFVIGQLEVVKPTVGLFSGNKLNDEDVNRLTKIKGVKGVFPKMKLTFPTSVRGGKALIGKDIWAELIADGIPPNLVKLDDPKAFQDFGAEIKCEQGGKSCFEWQTCEANICKSNACEDDGDCSTPGTYCSKQKTCNMPIPVVVSPTLVEIYNGSIHTAMSGASGALSMLPKLEKKTILGLEFEGVFGKSYLGRSSKGKVETERMRLVGFSDQAITLGATMPIGYVKRLNAKFKGQSASEEYHSILVETESNEYVADVSRILKDDMGYSLSDKFEQAERAGLLIFLMTLVFNLISLIILAIAAVNIMHTFLMLVLERKRELALMRAVGATRSNIRMLVLGEAVLLGLIGGCVGALLGFLSTQVVDLVFKNYVVDFPFKPESLFAFEPWMFAAGIGVSILFCVLGAAIPAIRASRIDPASALSGF